MPVPTKNIVLDRTLPGSSDAFVELGTFTLTHGSAAFNVSIIFSNANFSVTKQYMLSVSNSIGTAATWVIANPLSSAGSDGSEDFNLIINRLTATTFGLRLLRTGGTIAAGAVVEIKRDGLGEDTFDALNSTGTQSPVPTVFFENSIITQVGGQVGIGVTSPDDIFHVLKSSAASTFILESGTASGSTVQLKTTSRIWNMSNDSGGNWQVFDQTASATRLSINTSGNVGIGGVAAASTKLWVRSTQTSQGLFQNIGTTSGLSARLSVRCSGGTGGHSGIDLDNVNRSWLIQCQGSDGDKLIFHEQIAGFTRMVIDTSGNIGIGTTLPDSRLHVQAGSAGVVTALANTVLTVENNTNAYITLFTPDANERGILFGEVSSNVAGGIIYNNSDHPDGLQFRTAGNVKQVAIGSSGNLFILNSTAGLSLTSSTNGSRYGLKYGSAGTTGDSDDLVLCNRAVNGGLLFATDNGTGGGAGEILRLSIGGGATGGGLNFQASSSAPVSATNTATLRVTAAGVLQVSNNGAAFANLNTGGGTVAGSDSQVQFNSSGSFGADSNFNWDNTNKRLGIGTATPENTLHIESNCLISRNVNSTGGGNYLLRKGRGTAGSPTAVQVNDSLGGIDFGGHDGTAWAVNGAVIRAFASETWTNIAHGAFLRFETIPEGSVTALPRMHITSAGYIGIGTNAPNTILEVVSESTGTLTLSKYSEDSSGAAFLGAKARGTFSTPAAVEADDVISGFNATAHNGTDFVSVGGVRSFVEAIASLNVSSYVKIETSEVGAVTEKMRITGAGKVGIGTSSPNAKLNVSNVSGSFSALVMPVNVLIGAASEEDNCRIFSVTADNDTVAASSNVVLVRSRGTLATPLTVANADTIGNVSWQGFDGGSRINAVAIQVEVGGTVSSGIIPGILKFLVADTAGALAERMRIMPDGNVGIGTDTPTVSLQGVGDGSIIWSSNNTDATLKVNRFGVTHYTNAEEPFYGIVHIANTTANTLEIGGGSGIGNSATLINFRTSANNTTVTGTVRMSIDANGKVGIGETNPNTLLHVVDTGTPVKATRDAGASTTGVLASYTSHVKTSGNMADGYGSVVLFQIEDTAAVQNAIGYTGFVRDGADNSGKFIVATYAAGVAAETFTVNKWGNTEINQGINTTGSPSAFKVTAGAHTELTLSVESPDVDFNLARTVQFETGALTNQRAVKFSAPTYAFVGTSTITKAATVYISGAPVAGDNATLTNAYALWVDSGPVRIDSAFSLGGGSTPTLGTIGGSGPASAAQNEWIEIHTQNGKRFIPVWA